MSELEPIVVEAEVDMKIETGGRIDKDGNLNGDLKVHGTLSVDKGTTLKGETEEHEPLEVHLDVTETGDLKVGDETGDPVKITNIDEPEADTDATTKLYVDSGHRGRVVFCTADLPAVGESIRIARSTFIPTVELYDYAIGRNGKFGQVTEITSDGHLHIQRATVEGLGDALEAARWDVSDQFAEAKQSDPELTPEDYLASLSAGKYVLVDSERSVNYADNVNVGRAVISSIRAYSDEDIHVMSVFVDGGRVFGVEFSEDGTQMLTPIFVGTPEADGHAANKEYVDGANANKANKTNPSVKGGLTWSDNGNPEHIIYGQVQENKLLLFGTGHNGNIVIHGVATPTADNHAANKKYVDDNAVKNDQGVANAGRFMMVDSNGKVAPVEMSAWQGGNY